MTDTHMPATEATVASAALENEPASYEFAFHILPTVAEGEVPTVTSDLHALITKHSGEIFDQEEPQRFDLAYAIEKHIEGKNRSFTSAYFGWVRFRLDPEEAPELTAKLEADRRLLRTLVIRLSKVEEAHPFRFHEALEKTHVETIDEDGLVAAATDAKTNQTAEADPAKTAGAADAPDTAPEKETA